MRSAKNKLKYRTVSIPAPLAAKIEEKIADTGFGNISSFTTYVLREVLSEMGRERTLTKREAKTVTEKLRELGYMG